MITPEGVLHVKHAPVCPGSLALQSGVRRPWFRQVARSMRLKGAFRRFGMGNVMGKN